MRVLARFTATKLAFAIPLVAAAGLFALLLAFWPSAPAQQTGPSSAAGGPVVALKMSCPTCSYRVRKALVDLPGVRSAKVSLERGQALVTYQEGKVTVEQMIKAIEQAGYAASLIQAGPVRQRSRAFLDT
ncbi:MAG: heavy-metal-associated domain-containing protein [Candidatus Rokuibacteriota bacterium]